jgi:hypothetical protein
MKSLLRRAAGERKNQRSVSAAEEKRLIAGSSFSKRRFVA